MRTVAKLDQHQLAQLNTDLDYLLCEKFNMLMDELDTLPLFIIEKLRAEIIIEHNIDLEDYH